jgi:hypothetical protein
MKHCDGLGVGVMSCAAASGGSVVVSTPMILAAAGRKREMKPSKMKIAEGGFDVVELLLTEGVEMPPPQEPKIRLQKNPHARKNVETVTAAAKYVTRNVRGCKTNDLSEEDSPMTQVSEIDSTTHSYVVS